ncbi:MAG TPA: gamma-glutamyltransferase [Pirellulales bacterium]|nr:gamma-glutamyltransferase [Pirellulales bacterium]
MNIPRAFAWTLFALLAYASPAQGAGYDRPAKDPHQSRSVVVAEHGIVAASQPLAAQAGLDILKKGGTAADAAIATSAMLGLVEPMSCGIGGDVFVIYWDAKTQKLYGLNGSGRSPYNLNRDVFKQKGLKSIPGQGPLCWSVPGCVAGWEDLRARFGNKKLSEILEPAIAYAQGGFPVSEIIAVYWGAGAAGLKKYPDTAKTYLVDGKAPREGEMFRNPNLAASYLAIAAEGSAAFYRGAIAQKIVSASEANGGYMSLKDLADHHSDWVEPVSTNYRGYDVWELPPNGQGIAALQILNLIEPHDVRKMGRGSADWYHLFLEAKKLAFADRAKFYADPDFAKLPVAELISKKYAASRAKRLSMELAAKDSPPGNPLLEHGDTIYLTVVDKDRNCCSFIQSNFGSFGSYLVPGDVGFVMQNRGQLFALDDQHLNRLEPHKRPFHTIIPAMVTKDGKPWLSFGVMGGDMQAQGHVQILVDLIDFDMNVQEAGDEARIRHDGSAEPTGEPAEPDGGQVVVEPSVPKEIIAALQAKGHKVKASRGAGMGGYQAVLIDWGNGVLRGATEPRKDGCAAGY